MSLLNRRYVLIEIQKRGGIILALQIFMIQHYCTFYTLAAEYGSVVCDGVPMADIPAELQDSRVFKLHLRSNSLHRFPDSKLEGTGKLK